MENKQDGSKLYEDLLLKNENDAEIWTEYLEYSKEVAILNDTFDVTSDLYQKGRLKLEDNPHAGNYYLKNAEYELM